MIKNITSSQIILIILATLLLLLAAFSFYLLQDPFAPLPFAPSSPTGSASPAQPGPTATPAPSDTALPTRQTSYTPFAATATPSQTPVESPTSLGTPAGSATLSGTPAGSATTQPASSTPVGTITVTLPAASPTRTRTPATPSTTLTPSPSPTLGSGEYGVTGRLLLNGTPVSNAVLEFQDDTAPRSDQTDTGGHYYFTTLAPGTGFFLTFHQADNPQLTPTAQVASIAWIMGTLPAGVNPIVLPDLEVSLETNGLLFQVLTPVDGATYNASVINPHNPIQFTWTVYNQAVTYHVELGLTGSNDPIFSSNESASTSLMWDGTLDNGSHITQGTYWWRAVAKKPLGDFTLLVFSQDRDILFNP